MNKKIEEYKKKSNKIVRTLKLIGISIFLLGILISIVQYTLNKSKSNKENQNVANGISEYSIDLEEYSIIYQNKFDINLSINNFDETSHYKVAIDINNENSIEEEGLDNQNVFNIDLEDEGKKEINIIVYKDDEEKYNKTLNIYYIEPYKAQFLDELSKVGVVVHLDGIEPSKFQSIYMALGAQYIRSDLKASTIIRNNEYNFSVYDTRLKELLNNNIHVLAIIGAPIDHYGSDKLVSDENDLKRYERYVNAVAEHYPEILDYEIWNEPNAIYVTEEQMQWYAKMVNSASKILKEKNKKINVISGVVGYWATEGAVYPIDFMRKITENSAYQTSDTYSAHIYDLTTNGNLNKIYLNRSKQLKDVRNEIGGFIKNSMSEFGGHTGSTGISEYEQGMKIVQQNVLNQKNNFDLSIVYDLIDSGTDIDNIQHNFGLVKYNNYTPKTSYYILKNYYQNTNGAEYVGYLNFQSGLEAHVYDKDGKPLIIAWASDTNKLYDFTLNHMTAKDLYGKEILQDETGKIKITTSPVYLYSADYNTLYQAISNVTTTKYDEFTQKFAEQISKIPGLQASITKLKKSMQDISSNSTLNETTAINLMKEHYNLGTTILQAYKSGTLQVEDVKVSSMLDALDDIGDSFEDLVTVSAKTRNSNLTETKNLIATAEKLIKDNEDLEIIYPTKILNFSQDFYDKANYINGLEEENDIKTGLIVSKNLHSLLLANWANEFTKIYIDKAIANTPVEIEYSTTEPTNKEVTATLKTDAAITVTNNQNSKTHKFTENGEFTFEYTIRGQAFTKKATVTNIDKTPPTITGIENDGFYTGSVTPKATDTNLKEVKLYKDSTLVQNYANNSTIAEDGNYKIVATDKAGNETTVTFYICKIPATISYSETNLTNQNVTATINSNYDLQVTNNSGKKTYTFTNNGTFTFNYKIKGKSFTVTATVNNIDKKAPVVTGVEEGKLYIDQTVTPKATDENLKEVTLYLNSVKVNNFSSGTQITKEGFYKIVATDKAGNETTVNFNLMKNNSKEYKVQDKYIMNITSNTKKTDFIKNFNSTSQYQITRNGKALSNNDIIATGDILKSNNGAEYTLIVTGDINKDGDVDVVDIVQLRRYLLIRNNLDDAALLAADCNLDGESLSVTDLVKLRLIVLYKGAT